LSASLVDERATALASYRGLKAWDAQGRELHARMIPGPGGFGIRVEDACAEYPITVDPWLTGPDWTYDVSGFSPQITAGPAGDLNGDGFGDFIVGAPGVNATGVPGHDGVAWVFQGSASGLGPMPVATLTGPNFQGIAQTAFGSHIAPLGDVDGDGFDDFAISDWFQSNPDQGEGAAYVYRGSASGIVTSPFLTIEGGAFNAGLHARKFAGDINGDGRADILTLSYDDVSQTGNSVVRLYFGTVTPGVPTPAWVLTRQDLGSLPILDVAGVGDVNSDGYDDVGIVTTSGPPGSVRIYYGSPFGPTSIVADYAYTSASGSFTFIEPAGDFDGNGYADVLTSLGLFLADPPLHGPQSFESIPSNLATGEHLAGNVDGDVIPETLRFVGTNGAVEIYSGGSLTAGAALMFQLSGPSATGLPGGNVWSAGTAGDVNGDGRADTYCLDVQHSRASIVHGCPAPNVVNAPGGVPQVIQAPLPSSFGASITASGDVNGDGLSDLLVGAPEYSNGEMNEGPFISTWQAHPGIHRPPPGRSRATLQARGSGNRSHSQ
jgi:hypothetical protein